MGNNWTLPKGAMGVRPIMDFIFAADEMSDDDLRQHAKEMARSYLDTIYFLKDHSIVTVERDALVSEMAEAWNDPALTKERWEELLKRAMAECADTDSLLRDWMRLGGKFRLTDSG
jgi:hypothetical protein